MDLEELRKNVENLKKSWEKTQPYFGKQKDDLIQKSIEKNLQNFNEKVIDLEKVKKDAEDLAKIWIGFQKELEKQKEDKIQEFFNDILKK